MNDQEILDNAHEAATHVDNGGDYFKYSFRSRGKSLRSLADIKRIAELGKENALLKKVEQIFNDSPDLTFDCCKRLFGEEFKAHNLEQQAKGVLNLTKNNAETVQNYPWFVDVPPTLEYLYDVGFGMNSKTASYYAEGLLQQAKALKEQE